MYSFILYNKIEVYWYIFHWFAVLYPFYPSNSHKKIWYNFYNFFEIVMPLEYRKTYKQFKHDCPLELYLNNSFELFKWTLLFNQFACISNINNCNDDYYMKVYATYYQNRFESDRLIEFLLTLTNRQDLLEEFLLNLSDIKYFIMVCQIITGDYSTNVILRQLSYRFDLKDIRSVLLKCLSNYFRWSYLLLVVNS